jgi:hypothetical protein
MDGDCPACGATTVGFAVPEDLRASLPGSESAAALCTRCLALHPIDAAPAAEPSFQAISDAFPSDPDAALPMALLVGLLDNLALYRSEIATLLERVEQAGTDPLLVLDRLAHDPDVEAAVDLAGRRRQLEQLL